MVETDSDAADQFDAHLSSARQEGITGLWRRYWRLPRNVFAISLVSLLNDISSEIIYPLFPIFLSLILGASTAAIGLIEGASESVSSLLKLFGGYFSDRRGKRKGFVVFGYSVANFVRPLLAFTTSWPQAFAIRLTDRVGKGIRSAPRDAMIADSVAVEQRGLAFGFHRAMDHGGAVIGPLIGYVLMRLLSDVPNSPSAGDFRIVFLLASIPAVAAVLMVIFFLQEPSDDTSGRSENFAPVKLSLRGFDSNFKRFLFILLLFTLSNSSDVFLIMRAQDVGVSASTVMLLWAALHSSKVISSLFGGDLSDRLGRSRLIVSGWSLYAAVYAGFAFVTTEISVWILFLIYGVYFGLTEGAEKALVADLVRPERRGTAYGLYNLALSVAILPASLLMGVLWKLFGPAIGFLVSSALGGTAALLMFTLVKVPRRPRGDLLRTG